MFYINEQINITLNYIIRVLLFNLNYLQIKNSNKTDSNIIVTYSAFKETNNEQKSK